LAVGAGISAALVLHAGRNNKSLILPILFAGWVLCPYITLFFTYRYAKRWNYKAKLMVHLLMLFIVNASLIIYCGALMYLRKTPTAIFLMVPLGSLFFIAVIVAIIRSIFRRQL
jgi:hypothetical protein